MSDTDDRRCITPCPPLSSYDHTNRRGRVMDGVQEVMGWDAWTASGWVVGWIMTLLFWVVLIARGWVKETNPDADLDLDQWDNGRAR